MTLTKKLKTINAIISRVIFTKNFLITFLYIYTLSFKLRDLLRGILSLSELYLEVDSKHIYTLELSLVGYA